MNLFAESYQSSILLVSFFLLHWFSSLFAQTFYLHRYSAHKMFTMSRFWERVFFIFTFIAQGSSFLNPRAYAVMHRMHHAYSDTELDPHSPNFFKDVFRMMWHTRKVYFNLLTGRQLPESRFLGNYPEWPVLEKFADHSVTRIFWVAVYVGIYLVFAPSIWWFALIPVHVLMGPVHGAIVNWCGHKYGYRNFDLGDDSRNSIPIDFILLGELFQNNHHKYPERPNFAVKKFELDATYPVMRLLDAIGVIRLQTPD